MSDLVKQMRQLADQPQGGISRSEALRAGADRIAKLEAAIARAKAIDPYAGAGARGSGLSGSDAVSEYALAYRDAMHDALSSETKADGRECGSCGRIIPPRGSKSCGLDHAICEHPRERLFYHAAVSGRLGDYRCDECDTIVNFSADQDLPTSKTPGERWCNPLCVHGKHALERCQECELDGGTGFTSDRGEKR